MKESPVEPPKKKLKQARLPFQILSPPVVKNVDSHSSQSKRKACEAASSDEDVVVSETNENNIKPIEKKAKVVNNNKDQQKRHIIGTKDDETEEKGKPASASKQKSKKAISSSKKVNKTTPTRKSEGKNLSKAVENKNEKTKTNTSVCEAEVVDVVDLCDSPIKTFGENKESSTSVSKSKTVISDSDIKEEILSDSKKDSSSLEKSSIESIKSYDQSENITNDSSQKANTEVESSQIDKTTDKEASSEEITETSTSNKKSPGTKSSFKQPSIKDIVSSKSPKTISDSKTSSVNEEDKNDTKMEECSSACSTPTSSSSLSKSTTESVADDKNLKTPTTENDSPTVDDSSPTSECNTSSVSTPGTDPLKRTKTPRRMTPKQLLKLKEKEEKLKEKERLKEEKEKKKAEEKEEKIKLKKEKEEERLRLKQEKEDEKRKEKEEKEKKKQAELDKKNEEKRVKEEEKRQKEEEKQAREEEKRKKEDEERKKKEEKRLKEKQKEAEKRKSAQAFASFFVKTETKSVSVEEDKENNPVASNFRPFEVKNDMRLAPLVRSELPEERRQLLDSALEGSTETAEQRLYLEQLRSPSYVRGSSSRTWPPPDGIDDEIMIIESEMLDEKMHFDEDETENKPKKRCQRAKLLQFHTNRRPAYWGTWRKKSKLIRPRAPLNQDETLLEYEVDSDDEWEEEPEDGESIKGGEEDEEPQDEQYEEDDMFVPHGYLSDGEGEDADAEDAMDDPFDENPELMQAKLKLKQLEFEAEYNAKQDKLKPRIIGCVWFCNSETDVTNVGEVKEWFLLRRAVWDGPLPLTVIAPLPPSPSTPGGGATDESKSVTKKKLVNESLVPGVIKKVHRSRKKLSKLLLELMEEWERDKTEALPSKNCLAKKVREMAVWEKPPGATHHCWNVKEEVRQAYGLLDLELPPPSPALALPSPATNITKFTKVLTTDERLKLLRDSPSASKEAPKDVPKTPSTLSQNLKTPTVKLASASPVVKKRVPLITVATKESPKQNATSSMMNFFTKSAKSEGSDEQGTAKVVKEKKRITPITLTPVAAKPTSSSPSLEDDDSVIILDD